MPKIQLTIKDKRDQYPEIDLEFDTRYDMDIKDEEWSDLRYSEKRQEIWDYLRMRFDMSWEEVSDEI